MPTPQEMADQAQAALNQLRGIPTPVATPQQVAQAAADKLAQQQYNQAHGITTPVIQTRRDVEEHYDRLIPSQPYAEPGRVHVTTDADIQYYAANRAKAAALEVYDKGGDPFSPEGQSYIEAVRNNYLNNSRNSINAFTNNTAAQARAENEYYNANAGTPAVGSTAWFNQQIAAREAEAARNSGVGTGIRSAPALQAQIDVKKRSDYTSPATLGDKNTQALVAKIRANSPLLSEEAALRSALAQQLQDAYATPGIRDDQFFNTELQKANLNVGALASAYHHVYAGKAFSLPPNPFAAAGEVSRQAMIPLQGQAWQMAKTGLPAFQSTPKLSPKLSIQTARSSVLATPVIPQYDSRALPKPFLSTPGKVTTTVKQPTGAVPFLGVIPVVSDVLKLFEPPQITTTTVSAPREEKTVLARMAGSDSFKFKIATSMSGLESAPWVPSKGEINVGAPILGPVKDVGLPRITTSYDPKTGITTTTTEQDRAQESTQMVQKYDVSKQTVIPTYSSVSSGMSFIDKLDKAVSDKYIKPFTPTVDSATKSGLSLVHAGKVVPGKGWVVTAGGEVNFKKNAPYTDAAIRFFSEGIYGGSRDKPVTTSVNYVTGLGIGAAFRGASALVPKVEKVVGPTAAKVLKFAGGKALPATLTGLYGYDVASRATEEFKDYTPAKVSKKLGTIISTETVPLSFGVGFGYKLPETSGFVYRSAVRAPGEISNAIWGARQRLAGIERIPRGSSNFDFSVFPLRSPAGSTASSEASVKYLRLMPPKAEPFTGFSDTKFTPKPPNWDAMGKSEQLSWMKQNYKSWVETGNGRKVYTYTPSSTSYAFRAPRFDNEHGTVSFGGVKRYRPEPQMQRAEPEVTRKTTVKYREPTSFSIKTEAEINRNLPAIYDGAFGLSTQKPRPKSDLVSKLKETGSSLELERMAASQYELSFMSPIVMPTSISKSGTGQKKGTQPIPYKGVSTYIDTISGKTTEIIPDTGKKDKTVLVPKIDFSALTAFMPKTQTQVKPAPYPRPQTKTRPYTEPKTETKAKPITDTVIITIPKIPPLNWGFGDGGGSPGRGGPRRATAFREKSPIKTPEEIVSSILGGKVKRAGYTTTRRSIKPRTVSVPKGPNLDQFLGKKKRVTKKRVK